MRNEIQPNETCSSSSDVEECKHTMQQEKKVPPRGEGRLVWLEVTTPGTRTKSGPELVHGAKRLARRDKAFGEGREKRGSTENHMRQRQ